MFPAIRTQNLILCSYESSDAAALYAFMRDPVAMRYTYVAPSARHCSSRLEAYEAMRWTLGFAPWVARSQETSEVIGWGGLSVDPEEPQWGLEVSYAFAPSAWGKGHATELVQFSVGHAFGVLRAQEVRSFARPENAASIRVLGNCGFTLLRYEPSLQRNHYLVSAPGAA